MTREQQVLLMLKPKVKAFGFNQKELKGIAARIANNLTSEENASEEDVNAEIEAQIEAAIPFLQFAQSQSSRVIEEWRKNHLEQKEEDDDDDDEPLLSQKPKAPKKSNSKEEGNEQLKQLMDMVTKLTGEISSLKQEKTTDSRKTRLEKLLKDSGTFGSRTLKSFSKMKFENDEEFEEFFEEVETDLKSYIQERADAGLGGMTPPALGGKIEKKDEPFSDEEVETMAELL